MKKEVIEYYASLLFLVALSVVAALALIKYVLPAFLPFIIAFAVASATRKPAGHLSEKTKIPEKALRLLLSLLLTLLLFALLGVLIWQAGTSLFKLLASASEEGGFLSEILSIFDENLPIFEGLPDGLYDRIGEAFSAMISSALSAVASFLSSLVSTVPKIVLFITVTLIALVYFSLDLDRISDAAKNILPSGVKSKLTSLKDNILSLVGKYLRSYLTIMLITFAVMTVGLFILRVKNLFVIAMIIAALDILPVIGVGTVLIPWSIISFFSGDLFLGVGLIVLFLVNSVIRQLAEPKIVGKNLDLHPILTLIFIYVGYALFGVWGIILLPIAGVIVGVYLKKNTAAEVVKPAGTEAHRGE